MTEAGKRRGNHIGTPVEGGKMLWCYGCDHEFPCEVSCLESTAAAAEREIERLRAALAMARVSLKGARGLALDTDERQFDSEFARAIDRIDAALEPTTECRAAGLRSAR